MKLRLIGLGALAGLLLGIGVGFAIGQMGQSDGPARFHPATSTPDELAESTRRKTDPPSIEQSKPPILGDSASDADAEEAATLMDVLGRISLPAPRSGQGTISGRIIDEQNNPVPGFEVQLMIDDHETELPYPKLQGHTNDRDELEARLTYQYVSSRWRQILTQKLMTDADGRVEFTNLPGETAELRINGGDYVIDGGRSNVSERLKMGSTFEFVVTLGCKVTLHVEESPFEVGNKSRVVLENDDGLAVGTYPVWEGKSREFTIKPGRHTFRAISDEPKLASKRVVLNLNAGGTAQASFKLERGEGLAGVVQFPGARLRSYGVYVAKAPEGASVEEVYRPGHRDGATSIDVDYGTGTFLCDLKMQGDYFVIVANGETVLGWRRVFMADDPVFVEISVPSPTDGTQVSVHVQRPAGISSNKEDLKVLNGDSYTQVGVETWLVSDTEYLVVIRPYRDRELPETALVQISSHELGVATATFRPGIEMVTTVEFEMPVYARLILEDLPPSLKGGSLYLYRAPDYRQGHSTGVLRLEHAVSHHGATMRLLQPGQYRFELKPQHWDSFPVVREEVTIEPTTRTVRLKVPALHTIRLDRSRIVASNEAQIRQVSTDTKRNIRFDGDVVLLPDLTAGEYELTYQRKRHSEYKQHTLKFSVPGEETVYLPE